MRQVGHFNKFAPAQAVISAASYEWYCSTTSSWSASDQEYPHPKDLPLPHPCFSPWQRQRHSCASCDEIITDKALNIKLHTYLFWPARIGSVRLSLDEGHRRIHIAVSCSHVQCPCPWHCNCVQEHAMSLPAIQIDVPLLRHQNSHSATPDGG